MLKKTPSQLSKLSNWRICFGCPLKFYLSQDEAVVYHTGSGNTHLLNFMAYKILTFIQNSPQVSNDEIQSYLIQDLADDVDKDEFYQYVINVLEQLYALNLIDRLQS